MFKFKKSETDSTPILPSHDALAQTMTDNELAVEATPQIQLMPSIICQGAEIDGNFSYPGSLHLDGKFKGNIKAETVHIGKTGNFSGFLLVDKLVIDGNVKGEVKCKQLILHDGSAVSAKIHYEHIEIQSGAILTGHLLQSQH